MRARTSRHARNSVFRAARERSVPRANVGQGRLFGRRPGHERRAAGRQGRRRRELRPRLRRDQRLRHARDPEFQALSAPMLIDSYPLENAVIRSSLPAKMMAGLAKLDVTGLAVLGDEMRRPVGVRQPYLESGRLAGHHVRDLPVKDRGCRHPRSGGKARPGIRDRQRSGPRPRCPAGLRPEPGVLPPASPRNRSRLTSRPTSTCGPGRSPCSPTQAGSPSSPLPSVGS